MTATHELFNKIEEYLMGGYKKLAVDYMVRLGWSRRDASRQVRSVARQIYLRKQADAERKARMEEAQKHYKQGRLL